MNLRDTVAWHPSFLARHLEYRHVLPFCLTPWISPLNLEFSRMLRICKLVNMLRISRTLRVQSVACSCRTFHSLLRALTRSSHPGCAETHPQDAPETCHEHDSAARLQASHSKLCMVRHSLDCRLCISDGFSCDGNLLSAFAPLHYPVPSYPCAMCPTASTIPSLAGGKHIEQASSGGTLVQ